MTRKVAIKELEAEAPVGQPCHLLGRVSFEERSTSIARSRSAEKWGFASFFASKRRGSNAEARLHSVLTHFNGSLEPTILDTADPFQIAEQLENTVSTFVDRASGLPAIVDVTSFRREELLMLLSLLRSLDAEAYAYWNLAYVGARNMGSWLSGEVTSIHSVLGFPGEVWPSRPTRLIVLMGFEVVRARSIIDSYEPAKLIMGMGYRSDSINDELYQENKRRFDDVCQEFRESLEATFEFSASDPMQLVKELSKVIGDSDNSNTVIAPLHTKLSTIGVGLYALRNLNVQLCYASVDEYNEEAYSAPGESAYLIPVSSLF